MNSDKPRRAGEVVVERGRADAKPRRDIGEREKTRHPFDDLARQLLQQALQAQVTVTTASSTIDPLALVRGILRSFSAVEEQRSWYAKSLFPAHHSMLFWEGLRKGATKYRTVPMHAGHRVWRDRGITRSRVPVIPDAGTGRLRRVG